MEQLKNIMLDMQAGGGKLPRNLKNPAERLLFQQLTAEGWEVTKRGWPDFACFKGNNLALIEVKPNSRCHLKRTQQRLMVALANLGVKCFLWSPDGGFEPITPASAHLAPRQKLTGATRGRGGDR
ncbi:hypothetical protein ES705_28336 [subsurface metagenome]